MPNASHIPEDPGVVDARNAGPLPISALEPMPEDNPDALPKMHQFATYADLAEFLRTTPQNARSLCMTRTPTKGQYAGWTFISKLIDRIERRENELAYKRKTTGREIRVTYPNGDIEVFPTIRVCADALGVHPQNISQKLKTGKGWSRGKNVGVSVDYADTDGTGNIISRHT